MMPPLAFTWSAARVNASWNCCPYCAYWPVSAADTPKYTGLLLELLEVVVAHADVVDVGHLERQVVEAGLLVLEAEEDVMIDEILAAIAAVE